MNKTDYKKIEYYLYNYSNIDKLIDEIKDGLINSVNVSGSAWRKGITVCKKVLVFLLQKYPKYYDFISLKYFQKQSKDEIEETLKFDFKKQKIIKDKLIEFVYKNAKMRNLV